MIVVVTHFLPELHVCTYMCTMYLYMYMYTNLHALVHTKELETKKNWLASTRLLQDYFCTPKLLPLQYRAEACMQRQ